MSRNVIVSSPHMTPLDCDYLRRINAAISIEWEGAAIKRVIDGKSYNTETSTEIYTPRETIERFMEGYSKGNVGLMESLYQTKDGAFFVLWWHTQYSDEREHLTPLSNDEASEWLKKHGADSDTIEKAFASTGAGENRITLRLPGNLHSQVAASAAAAGLSLNTYITRVLKRTENPSERRYWVSRIDPSGDSATLNRTFRTLEAAKQAVGPDLDWQVLGDHSRAGPTSLKSWFADDADGYRHQIDDMTDPLRIADLRLRRIARRRRR